MDTRKPLTTGKIAKYCHVNFKTVLKWIADGQIKAYKLPSGANRVRTEDFIVFLKQHNLPIPSEFNSLGRTKILIVDDEINVIHGIKRILKKQQYVIESALDGFEAGQKIIMFEPDIVLLDLQMPGLDGYEVLRRMRTDEKTKHVKVIIISGNITRDGMKKLNDLGANAILEKPIRGEVLLNTICKQEVATT